MEAKEAGESLDSMISSFNSRISELQQLVIARNMYPASSLCDLSAIDAVVKGMELQVANIKNRMRDETRSIPKAKKLIEAALLQKKKLESISSCIPARIPEFVATYNQEASNLHKEVCNQGLKSEPSNYDPEPVPKGKKAGASPPTWYITSVELNTVPSYIKQRLNLDKVNAAISDMATYAETNAKLIAAPRNKLTETDLEKALELRETAGAGAVKGKHFFLETDIKGPTLKHDNTGRALLTRLESDLIGSSS